MNGIETATPKTIKERRLLIGEGVEEVLFFGSLLKELGIGGIQVEDYRGKDGLELYLRTLKTRPGFAGLEALGITRDADADPIAAAASVTGAIRRAQFSQELAVRTCLLPAANQPGALEDLCLAALTGSPLEHCLDEYFDCAGRIMARTFETPALRAKARIHAWLAVQNPPDLRLGIAAQKGLIDWVAPVFADLKHFLRELGRAA